MLRTTWEKTNNPYLRLLTMHHRPALPLFRQVSIIRPPSSSRASLPPVKALLFFNGTEEQLRRATEIVVDFPGGGFVAMGPECHEERLRRWARRMNKPVLGVNYGKAPECKRCRADLTTTHSVRSVPMGHRRGFRSVPNIDGNHRLVYRNQEQTLVDSLNWRFCVSPLMPFWPGLILGGAPTSAQRSCSASSNITRPFHVPLPSCWHIRL